MTAPPEADDLTWNFSQVFGDKAGEGEISEGALLLA